jgi:hypothetical protein
MTEGDLTLQVLKESANIPKIMSFQATRDVQQEKDHLDWKAYEMYVLEAFSYDILGKGHTSYFGNLVLYLAARQRGTTQVNNKIILDLEPDELIKAIQSVFVAVYRTTAAIHSFVSVEQPQILTDGKLEVPTMRLFVVPWVAGIILAVLTLGTIMGCMAIFVTLRHQAHVFEEPAGLLSMAGILDRSPLMEVATRVRLNPDYDGRFVRDAAAMLDSSAKWRLDMSSTRGPWAPVLMSGNRQ